LVDFERTDISFASDAAKECTLEELMEDETHEYQWGIRKMSHWILLPRGHGRRANLYKARLANRRRNPANIHAHCIAVLVARMNASPMCFVLNSIKI